MAVTMAAVFFRSPIESSSCRASGRRGCCRAPTARCAAIFRVKRPGFSLQHAAVRVRGTPFYHDQNEGRNQNPAQHALVARRARVGKLPRRVGHRKGFAAHHGAERAAKGGEKTERNPQPQFARRDVQWPPGASATATPIKMTAMQAISGRFNFVPSQNHSINAANGAVKHCTSSTARRLPSRGSA